MITTMQGPQLLGFLGTGLGATKDPKVKELQEALANLAMVAGNPAINPGPATGIADQGLLVSLTFAQQIILKNVDKTTSYLVSGLFLALSVAKPAEIESKIRQYAAQITVAVKAAASYILAKGASTPLVPPRLDVPGQGASGGTPPVTKPPASDNPTGALDSFLDIFKTDGKWSPIKLGGAGALLYLAYTTLGGKK